MLELARGWQHEYGTKRRCQWRWCGQYSRSYACRTEHRRNVSDFTNRFKRGWFCQCAGFNFGYKYVWRELGCVDILLSSIRRMLEVLNEPPETEATVSYHLKAHQMGSICQNLTKSNTFYKNFLESQARVNQ